MEKKNKGDRLALGVSFHPSSYLFSLDLKLTEWVSLVGQHTLGILLSASPVLGFQTVSTMSVFSHECWRSKLRFVCLCGLILRTSFAVICQGEVAKFSLPIFPIQYFGLNFMSDSNGIFQSSYLNRPTLHPQ